MYIETINIKHKTSFEHSNADQISRYNFQVIICLLRSLIADHYERCEVSSYINYLKSLFSNSPISFVLLAVLTNFEHSFSIFLAPDITQCSSSGFHLSCFSLVFCVLFCWSFFPFFLNLFHDNLSSGNTCKSHCQQFHHQNVLKNILILFLAKFFIFNINFPIYVVPLINS